MLQRPCHQNLPYHGPASAATHALERDGHLVLREVFTAGEITELRTAIERVYDEVPPDPRAGRTSPENAAMFRYEMLNRSAECQHAIANRGILDVLAPLIGHDCHAISCTAWRNPPGTEHAPRGQEWHTDAGPHVPRDADVDWPADIPFPIFVVATHIYLQDLSRDDGPTAVIPGSHTSGRIPPAEMVWDLNATYRGRESVHHEARAGDVGFFVSDVWHRRLPPTEQSRGRFFLQTNYGRREIAQRLRPTELANHLSPAAIERARTERERTLIGLHPATYYDG
ncbi:MAG: phytanoyl-CoA dioxygenase family protein [bacterium]|nr:phytanoyl-CoA dioxygenase family protein [bacterium]